MFKDPASSISQLKPNHAWLLREPPTKGKQRAWYKILAAKEP